MLSFYLNSKHRYVLCLMSVTVHKNTAEIRLLVISERLLYHSAGRRDSMSRWRLLNVHHVLSVSCCFHAVYVAQHRPHSTEIIQGSLTSDGMTGRSSDRACDSIATANPLVSGAALNRIFDRKIFADNCICSDVVVGHIDGPAKAIDLKLYAPRFTAVCSDRRKLQT